MDKYTLMVRTVDNQVIVVDGAREMSKSAARDWCRVVAEQGFTQEDRKEDGRVGYFALPPSAILCVGAEPYTEKALVIDPSEGRKVLLP